MEKRISFELFKSHVCHKVKNDGDLRFISNTLKSDEIRRLFQMKWYPESLYLLAMIDYLSRENDIPLCNKYDDIRNTKLKERVFPSGIILLSFIYNNEEAKNESVKKAIPEFLKFNIVESEIRNVC